MKVKKDFRIVLLTFELHLKSFYFKKEKRFLDFTMQKVKKKKLVSKLHNSELFYFKTNKFVI